MHFVFLLLAPCTLPKNTKLFRYNRKKHFLFHGRHCNHKLQILALSKVSRKLLMEANIVIQDEKQIDRDCNVL